jgi:hypothetical protein
MGHDEQLAVCLEKWKQVEQHLLDSPGFRDKIIKIELRIDILEKEVMKNAIVGGLIGALIGSGAAPAINHIIGFILGG